jgi:hypothetical protein
MAKDIEEFLRRAAERRKQQQQQLFQQQSTRTPPQQPSPSRTRDVRKSATRPRLRSDLEIEIIEAEHNYGSQSVDEHVRQHIDTKEIVTQVESLGQKIQSAGKRVAERIHSKFDHDIAKLDDLPSIQDAQLHRKSVSPVAQAIVQQLRTPSSARQAILLAEILARPNFDR